MSKPEENWKEDVAADGTVGSYWRLDENVELNLKRHVLKCRFLLWVSKDDYLAGKPFIKQRIYTFNDFSWEGVREQFIMMIWGAARNMKKYKVEDDGNIVEDGYDFFHEEDDV